MNLTFDTLTTVDPDGSAAASPAAASPAAASPAAASPAAASPAAASPSAASPAAASPAAAGDGANNEDGDDENTEEYFKTPEEWFQNFKKRFDAVVKGIPPRSSHAGVQRNIQIADAYANEISRLNSRRQIYMGRENISAVAFMQGQESRLNRLGLFTYPMTWSSIRCGAGYLSSDCGRIGKADSKAHWSEPNGTKGKQ